MPTTYTFPPGANSADSSALTAAGWTLGTVTNGTINYRLTSGSMGAYQTVTSSNALVQFLHTLPSSRLYQVEYNSTTLFTIASATDINVYPNNHNDVRSSVSVSGGGYNIGAFLRYRVSEPVTPFTGLTYDVYAYLSINGSPTSEALISSITVNTDYSPSADIRLTFGSSAVSLDVWNGSTWNSYVAGSHGMSDITVLNQLTVEYSYDMSGGLKQVNNFVPVNVITTSLVAVDATPQITRWNVAGVITGNLNGGYVGSSTTFSK